MKAVYFVYFAQVRNTCKVKIGITRDRPRTRIQNQSCAGRRLMLMATIPTSDPEVERMMLWMCRRHRIAGEWFKLSPWTLFSLIQRWVKNPSRIKSQYRAARKAGWRHRHISPEEIISNGKRKTA